MFSLSVLLFPHVPACSELSDISVTIVFSSSFVTLEFSEMAELNGFTRRGAS